MGEMKRLTRCLTLAALVGVAMMALFAPGAAADAPGKVESVLRHRCPDRYVRLSRHHRRQRERHELDFFDASGTLTRFQIHASEQATFSANGHSLTSIPFAYNVTVRFDSSGNITDAVISGVIVKVPLPDGGLFISAGWVDYLARGLTQFIDFPTDVGASVNLDRFCEALAP